MRKTYYKPTFHYARRFGIRNPPQLKDSKTQGLSLLDPEIKQKIVETHTNVVRKIDNVVRSKVTKEYLDLRDKYIGLRNYSGKVWLTDIFTKDELEGWNWFSLIGHHFIYRYLEYQSQVLHYLLPKALENGILINKKVSIRPNGIFWYKTKRLIPLSVFHNVIKIHKDEVKANLKPSSYEALEFFLENSCGIVDRGNMQPGSLKPSPIPLMFIFPAHKILEVRWWKNGNLKLFKYQLLNTISFICDNHDDKGRGSVYLGYMNLKFKNDEYHAKCVLSTDSFSDRERIQENVRNGPSRFVHSNELYNRTASRIQVKELASVLSLMDSGIKDMMKPTLDALFTDPNAFVTTLEKQSIKLCNRFKNQLLIHKLSQNVPILNPLEITKKEKKTPSWLV